MSILNNILENTMHPAPVSVFDLPVAEREETKPIVENKSSNVPQLFEVEKLPLSGPYGQIDKKGIFVKGKCINVVSDKYEIHQPQEIVDTFYKVVESHGLEVNRVIPNATNGGLLLSAKYADKKIGGEDHTVNLTFFTAHDGKRKTFLSLDTLRIACFNQVPALYRNKSRWLFSEKHYANSLDMDLLGKLLTHVPESIEKHNEKIETLQNVKLSFSDFVGLWIDHYKQDKQAKQFNTKVEKLRSVYYNATGQRQVTNDTAYKAFNAMTFINTHDGRNTALKDQNSFIDGGNDSLEWMHELIELSA